MIMFYFKLIFLILSWITTKAYSQCSCNNSSEASVKLVSVLFRHGDRTNDVGNTYPNDPYKNFTYPPYGLGQLTNKGKQRMFDVGVNLAQTYGSLLKGLCRVEDLDTRTTDMTRTKMTALLVLSGLCNPKNTVFEWKPHFDWQPIPYNYVPFEQDEILTISLFYCQRYAALYNEYANSPTAQLKQLKYSRLFRYLTKHTGTVVDSTMDVFTIYFGLLTESEFGLALPVWTQSVFPTAMRNAVIEVYKALSATKELKKLSGGFFIRRIISDMDSCIKGELKQQMLLYSAHEMNIAYVLNALNVYYPHIPNYGSNIRVELLESNGDYFVKVYYNANTEEQPMLLTIPGCECCCPLNKFKELLAPNIPTKNDTCTSTKRINFPFSKYISLFTPH